MKVKELIEKLQTFDLELEVTIVKYTGGAEQLFDIEVEQCSIVDICADFSDEENKFLSLPKNKDKQVVLINNGVYYELHCRI